MRILTYLVFTIFTSLMLATTALSCPNASLVIETCMGDAIIPHGSNGPVTVCAGVPVASVYYWCGDDGPPPSVVDRICVFEKLTDGTYIEIYCESIHSFSFTPEEGKSYRFDVFSVGSSSSAPYYIETEKCLDIAASQNGNGCEGYFLAGQPINIGVNLPYGLNGGCYNTDFSTVDAYPFQISDPFNGSLNIDPCLYEKDTCFNVIVQIDLNTDPFDPGCEDCPPITLFECVKICTRPQTITETIVKDTTFCDGWASLQASGWSDKIYWTTPDGCSEGQYVEGTTSGQYIAQHINYWDCSMWVEIFNVTVDCCIDMDCISMPDEICEGQPVCVEVDCDFDFPIWHRWVVTELNGAWEDRVVKAHIETGEALGDICISNYWDGFVPGKSYGISLDVCRTCWNGETKCETKYIFFTYKAKEQYAYSEFITCGESINIASSDLVAGGPDAIPGCGDFQYALDITNQLGLLGTVVSPKSTTVYTVVYDCCEVTFTVNVENPEHEINICAEEGEWVEIDLPCEGFSHYYTSGPFPIGVPLSNPYRVTGSESIVVYTEMANGCICETTVNIVVPQRVKVHAFYCADQPFFDISSLIPPGCEGAYNELIDINSGEVMESTIITPGDFIYGDQMCLRQNTYSIGGCLTCIIDISIELRNPPCEQMMQGMYCDGSMVEEGNDAVNSHFTGDIKLTPNPAIDQFQIALSASVGIEQIFVTRAGTGKTQLISDLRGQRLKDFQIEVDCTRYISGVYSIIALLENGKIISKQIVIE